MDINRLIFMILLSVVAGLLTAFYITKRKPELHRPFLYFVLGWVSAGLFEYLVTLLVTSGVV